MPAQRWYFSSSTAAPISPAFSAGWTKQDLAERFKLLTTAQIDNSTYTNATKISGTTGGYDLSYQHVGDAVGAGSTVGTETFKSQFLCREGGLNVDIYAAQRIWMAKPDGTVRCVLYELANTGGTEFTTSNTNRKFPAGAPVTLSPGTWLDGDYPVVESGGNMRAAGPITAQNIVLRNGTGTGLTDLPEDETTTAGNRPWCEFSFTFAAPGASTDFAGGVIFAHPAMSSTETETENYAGGTTFAHPTLSGTATETENLSGGMTFQTAALSGSMAETLQYASALTFGPPALAATLEESFLLTGGLTIGHPALDGTFTVSGSPVTPSGRSARSRVPLWPGPIDDDEDAIVTFIAAHRRPFA